MVRSIYECEICNNDIFLSGEYGSGYCKECGTQYEYEEKIMMVLDDAQKKALFDLYKKDKN